uniref:Core-binding factor subunit beta n=1 Tax=Taeniopygia guttata TaxID=59729 RepID=A0A674GAQ5_TAEGU
MARLFGRVYEPGGSRRGGSGLGAGAGGGGSGSIELRRRLRLLCVCRGRRRDGRREGGAPPAGANKGRGERWGWDSAGRAGGREGRKEGSRRRRPHHHAAGCPRPAEQVRERGVLQEAEPRVRGKAAVAAGLPLVSLPPPAVGKVSLGRGGAGAAPHSSRLRREPSRRRGEAQSVRSSAPLSPGLAPPDCAPCSPQIKYTGFRDRPHEERQARFQNACRDGRSEIAFVATGTNLSLQFFPASWQGEQRQTPTREYVDFEREGGKRLLAGGCAWCAVPMMCCPHARLGCDDSLRWAVYLKAPMILNGVCVIWKGWIDLQRLDGMGCLEFDEERAQQEDALAQQAFEEARRRTREFEDRDRSHREEMEVRVSQLLSVTGKKTARP